MSGATVRPVPNAEGTPRRTVRISDELWKAVMEKAKERGETNSDVVRAALVRYLRRK